MDFPISVQRVLGVSALFLLAIFPYGCSISQQHLSSPVAGMKQAMGMSQYYVKSTATLRAKPDKSSKAQGQLAANTKVTEISKNSLGWSHVKAAESGLEGWIPTAMLAGSPVKARTSVSSKEKTDKQPPPQSEPSSPSEALQASSPPPAQQEKAESTEEKQSSDWLSPRPASASETAPPEAPAPKAQPAGRKAEPEMFDSF